MIQYIFTVHDSKAEAFLNPFYATNRMVAQRMFASACNDENHDFVKNAGDYTLFELGTFNDSSAMFKPHKTPINLGLALTYRRHDDLPPQQSFDIGAAMPTIHEAGLQAEEIKHNSKGVAE